MNAEVKEYRGWGTALILPLETHRALKGPLGRKKIMFSVLKRKADSSEVSASEGLEIAAFRQMVDQMPINVMTCDLVEFKINYVNQSTLDTAKTLEHVLPVKADELLGTCVDIFHKDPAHQRRLLSDPTNLPHQAQITVAGEILDLLVTAIYDASG
jgi:methyl-accepting chemotaxis protein